VPDDISTDFIFDAFSDLQTCRTDAGAIPWSAARLYAADHGLDAESFKMLWTIIKAMDAAEREWSASSGGDDGEINGEG